MNFKTPIYTLAAIALLSACSADESYKYTEVDPDAPIALSGAVNDGEPLTRGDGVVKGYTVARNISLFRENTNYDATYDFGPLSATLGIDRIINTGLFYLTEDAATSKLIGVYPAIVPANFAAGKVTYSSIDGATDIMASNLVEGSKTTAMPAMTFDHLLTRVIVNIQATAAGDGKWGTVNSISVEGKKQDIVVTLPAPTTTGKATITTGGTATNLFLTTDAGGTPTTTAPTTTSRLYGQAMFAPVTSAAKLTLSVVTANGTFTVDTDSRIYEAGKEYTINLSFSATGITLINTTISEWGNGGSQAKEL